MEKLIRELIDAAYDTGHYAGDGRSGTDLHRKRIEDRDVLRDKLETRLTAADALAEKIKQYENDRDFYIPQGIIDALREYEATK